MATLKPKNLPQSVLLALATYYYHRNKQWAASEWDAREKIASAMHLRNDSSRPAEYVWNKQADLDTITKACPKWLSWCSSASTFWFTYKNKYGTVVTRQVYDGNYLDGGEISIKRKEKPVKVKKLAISEDLYEADPEAQMYNDEDD